MFCVHRSRHVIRYPNLGEQIVLQGLSLALLGAQIARESSAPNDAPECAFRNRIYSKSRAIG